MNTLINHVALASLLAALAGCAGNTSSPSSTSDSPPPEQADAANDEAPSNSLADLAQRDVDAFLASQKDNDNEPDDASEQAEDDEQAAPSHREMRRIIWNQGPANDDDSPLDAPVRVSLPDDAGESLMLGGDTSADDDPEQQSDDLEGDAEATALDRDRVRELVVDLSKELYRDAAHADMPLRELFLIAATTLVSPDRALNADAIPGLTQRERDVLREFQAFFVELGEQLDGSHDVDEVIVQSIDELRNALRTEPQLQLGSTALCTRVGGFGDFDQFKNYAFLAHSEQQAVVYIELNGFTSELNDNEKWVTELSQQLTIYSDRDGIPVWREDWQSAVDVSKNKRNDFFVVQVITFPKALSVGRYHLKLRLRDEKSGAEAEGSIPFEMVADPKMASGSR